MSSSSSPTGLVIDQTTILSLLSTLAILAAAYLTSLYTLPITASTITRFLFIWHAFDALIHFILEGTFLYNCFFSFGPTLLTEPLLPANVYFLGRAGRNYGAAYGEHWHSALWREALDGVCGWATGLLDLFAVGQREMGKCVVLDVCACYWRALWW
ncbi:hypothetical protein KCU78_g23198, partial [Aureobasidium melanogenum]